MMPNNGEWLRGLYASVCLVHSMDLTDSQRQALDQLRELTNGANDESSISILQSVDWNVQVNYSALSVIRLSTQH